MSTNDEKGRTPQRHTAGKIVYETSWVRDPAGPEDRGGVRARALRHNVASPRVVYFDGKSSRTEEVNADYGFRSPCLKLWLAGRDTMLYCKELPHLHFCITMPRPPEPAGSGMIPNVTPTGETRTIAGIEGRGARVARGPMQLTVVHAPGVVLDDPTGAVDRVEGVSGLVLQQEGIATSPALGYTKRVTVTELSFTPPAASLFEPPAGFQLFDGIDAARAEDHRLGEAQAAAELQRRPLSVEERERYLGRWQLVDAPDAQLLEVSEADAGYRVRSIESGETRDETATLLGRLLRVDQPPNYRLYRLEPDGQHLVLVGDEAFRYRRAAPR